MLGGVALQTMASSIEQFIIARGCSTFASHFSSSPSHPFIQWSAHFSSWFRIVLRGKCRAIARGAFEFVLGLMIGFGNLLHPNSQTELAYPTQRGPITAMYNSSWYLGSIVGK